jgi:hypothetical protein
VIGFFNVSAKKSDIVGAVLQSPSSQYPLQHSPDVAHTFVLHIHPPSTQSAPQHSAEVVQLAPLTHVVSSSIFFLDHPKTSTRNVDVAFLSTSRTTRCSPPTAPELPAPAL